MRALDRKLVRDVDRLRGQVVTISLVVACGIATLVTAVTTYRSLEASRDAFYAQAHFADLFVRLERAPRALLARLADVPGVSRVEGRVVGDFRLEAGEGEEPLLGRFVSVKGAPGSRLNDVLVREGRGVDPGASREVVVSELFARARGLRPGASVVAVLDGRRVELRVVGLGVSPEFVWAIPPQTGLPDAEHFGVLWMDERALAAVLGLSGAFNDAVVELAAGADPAEVAAGVDRLLEPYGGSGTVDREHQSSNHFVGQKIEQFRGMARFVPLLFLAVAAFLLHLLLSRLVATQREQIATLKAVGYGTGSLVRHYALFALVICTLGATLGLGIGALGGRALVDLYTRYFNLPAIVFRLDAGAAVLGIAVSYIAGVAGAVSAVWRTVRLPPAEAMQPAPPESFRPTALERLGLDRIFSPAGRMVLRDMERRPLRLLFSTLAVAFATSLLVVGGTALDSLRHALEVQFSRIQGEDLAVAFDRPRDARVMSGLRNLPGTSYVEPLRTVPVRLRAGWRKQELPVVGVPPDAALRRLRDSGGEPLVVPSAGLGLSRPLGEILGVGVGDDVEVEVLEAGRKRLRLSVAGFVDDFAGLSGYMDLAELERRLGEPPTATGAVLSVERSSLADVTRRLQRLPAVVSVSRPELARRQFEEQVADVYRTFQLVLALFAAVIAVGVVFNNARIALSMRGRDLATLRILGFRRGEVALVLLGEQAVQVLLGVAVGLPLGRFLGGRMLASVPPELFRIPVVLSAGWQAAAAAVVLSSGLASALLVRREADRLDLVAVLKARD